MKTSTFLFFILFATSAMAQTTKAKFNNHFTLKDGIYTSYQELLNNTPLFPDCIIQPSNDKMDDPDNINKKKLKYSVIGNEKAIMKFTSPLFATVLKGKLNIFYEKELSTTFIKGTICTFIFVKDPYYYYDKNNKAPSSFRTPDQKALKSKYKSYICILDIQTGKISKLTKEDLGLIIIRDSVLYQRYLKIKPGKKNKNLFAYISEFNERNATFIQINEENISIEEEAE